MTHWHLAFAMALIGYVFTSKAWLLKMKSLSPETGAVVKQLLVIATALALTKLDGRVTIGHGETLGVVLVYTAFVIIFNYQSAWLVDAGAPEVGEHSVDGAVYHRSREVLEPERARLFTFVLVPFVLVAIGTKVLHGRQVNLA